MNEYDWYYSSSKSKPARLVHSTACDGDDVEGSELANRFAGWVYVSLCHLGIVEFYSIQERHDHNTFTLFSKLFSVVLSTYIVQSSHLITSRTHWAECGNFQCF